MAPGNLPSAASMAASIASIPVGSSSLNWQRFDEMDEVGGDGSAELDDDRSLEIEIRFHLGDEAILKARKW